MPALPVAGAMKSNATNKSYVQTARHIIIIGTYSSFLHFKTKTYNIIHVYKYIIYIIHMSYLIQCRKQEFNNTNTTTTQNVIVSDIIVKPVSSTIFNLIYNSVFNYISI